jgi:photosystem II stability/assembly factor-like uncharacterized protein
LDGGSIFKALYLPTLPLNITEVTDSPADPQIVYFGISIQNYAPFWSHDGGETWHQPEEVNERGLATLTGFYFSSPFACHPRDALIALTSSNGSDQILKTRDGGRSWIYSGSGFCGGRMSDIVFGKDRMIFCLTDFGLWETFNNCSTFKQIDIKRMLGSKSSSSGAICNNTIIASLGKWGEKALIVSQNLGKNWKYFKEIVGSFRVISFNSNNSDIVYAGKYRSDDRGNSWGLLDHEIWDVFKADGNIVYSMSKTNTKIGAQIIKSHDRGKTWPIRYPKLNVYPQDINDIKVSPIDQDLIYVATTNGIWVLKNNKWQKKDEKYGLDRDYFDMCFIQCLGIDPSHSNVVYAGRRAPNHGVSNGIFRSMDSGETWENISGNLGENISIWAIKINPYNSDVYVGTSLGTYRLK